MDKEIYMRDMIKPEERLNFDKGLKDSIVWSFIMFAMILSLIVLVTC